MTVSYFAFVVGFGLITVAAIIEALRRIVGGAKPGGEP
jgi:hypothetical protein